jgi:transcriptional regulator with XRE-family HTH domain
MKSSKWFQRKLNKFKEDPEFIAETTIIDVSERITELMELLEMNRKELAKKMRCSSPYITKVLGGSENLTIRTLVNLAQALDCKVNIELCPKWDYISNEQSFTPVKSFNKSDSPKENYERNPFPIAA